MFMVFYIKQRTWLIHKIHKIWKNHVKGQKIFVCLNFVIKWRSSGIVWVVWKWEIYANKPLVYLNVWLNLWAPELGVPGPMLATGDKSMFLTKFSCIYYYIRKNMSLRPKRKVCTRQKIECETLGISALYNTWLHIPNCFLKALKMNRIVLNHVRLTSRHIKR